MIPLITLSKKKKKELIGAIELNTSVRGGKEGLEVFGWRVLTRN